MSFAKIKNKGYWTVGNNEFDNKVKAILFAQQNNLNIEDINYHYNDTWWDQYDWTVEPSESLEDLYIQRAKQLREKYDTIILRFSGGADSYNILRTFVDNNIKIDFIHVGVWSEGDPNHDVCPINIEKKTLVWPVLDEIRTKGVDFKVVVSDASTGMSNIGDDPQWFLRIDAPRFSVVDVAIHQWARSPEVKDYDNNKTCYVLGVDKPYVWCKSDKIWYWSTPDVLHTMHTQCNQMIPEPFYWTADMPKIPIKQAHVMKNYYSNHLDLMTTRGDVRTIFSPKSRSVPLIYPKYFGHVDPALDTLPYYDMTCAANEYKKSHNLTEGAPRGMGHDFTIEQSSYYDNWRKGIDLADTMLDQRFKNYESIWQAGLKYVWSKKRWLGI